MGVTEQGRDVWCRIRAHQPIGAVMLETHILQSVEIAQQFLPFRRGAYPAIRFTRELVFVALRFASATACQVARPPVRI